MQPLSSFGSKVGLGMGSTRGGLSVKYNAIKSVSVKRFGFSEEIPGTRITVIILNSITAWEVAVTKIYGIS